MAGRGYEADPAAPRGLNGTTTETNKYIGHLHSSEDAPGRWRRHDDPRPGGLSGSEPGGVRRTATKQEEARRWTTIGSMPWLAPWAQTPGGELCWGRWGPRPWGRSAWP